MRQAGNFLYNRPLLLLAIFGAIAYLPVLLPFFHLKNDLITQNLPTRFVFGETLYSGYEPFWNPFLSNGIPQYGDMNNGFWNPVQWLIGSVTGYSLLSITLEEFFYLILGGWGIYLVAKDQFDKGTSLMTAMAYMTCGYVTGHLQYFCWITGAGFFPYVLLFFLRSLREPVWRNFLSGGLSIFLFTAATHPGLQIGALYFFLFLTVFLWVNRKGMTKGYHTRHFIPSLLLLLGCGALASTVVIVSNLDILPHLTRSGKVPLEQALWHPTTWPSYLSQLFPLAVQKGDFFRTDIGMRNTYLGLANLTGLLVCIRYLFRRSWSVAVIAWLFFLLLSSGGFFKVLAWNYLPLLGTVRLNGEFTYFVLLILLGFGAMGLQRLRSLKEVLTPLRILKILSRICIVTTLTAVIGMYMTGDSIFVEGPLHVSGKAWVKAVIEQCSFWDLLLIQSLIQWPFLLAMKQETWNPYRIALIGSINLIVTTWAILPFTGLGMRSRNEVQSVIDTFGRGIPEQPLVPVRSASYIRPDDEAAYMLIASYSRRIGSVRPDQYPIQLKTNSRFVTDSVTYAFMQKQPVLFVSSDTTVTATTRHDDSLIRIHRMGPGYLNCTVRNDTGRWLIWQQNNYAYWSVTVNGIKARPATAYHAFMAVRLQKGVQEVTFRFVPVPVKRAMIVSAVFIATFLILLLSPRFSGKRVFR
ncbi:MAG: hypothetical protein RJA57_477 [Bacteroidota bacterium]